jgi:hypothetical protein
VLKDACWWAKLLSCNEQPMVIATRTKRSRARSRMSGRTYTLMANLERWCVAWVGLMLVISVCVDWQSWPASVWNWKWQRTLISDYRNISVF